MINPQSRAAFRRVLAGLLGMGQTRLELLGVELVQARQATVVTLLWSLVAVLALAFASLFAGVAVIALCWETHRMAAILGCVAAYSLLAAYAWVRLKRNLAEQPALFEATLEELGKDRQAILDSIGQDEPSGSTLSSRGGV